jgi:hypothetical protein
MPITWGGTLTPRVRACIGMVRSTKQPFPIACCRWRGQLQTSNNFEQTSNLSRCRWCGQKATEGYPARRFAVSVSVQGIARHPGAHGAVASSKPEDYGSNGGGRGRTSLTTQYIVLRTAMSSLCRGRAESRVCIRYFLLVSNRPPTLQHDDILKSENMNSALSYRYL